MPIRPSSLKIKIYHECPKLYRTGRYLAIGDILVPKIDVREVGLDGWRKKSEVVPHQV